MRKVRIPQRGTITGITTYEGESIEQQIARRMTGSDIEIGGKAMLYTERKDGVVPITNIRSDRFDMAQSALDSIERNRVARRDAMYKEQAEKRKESNNGKTESTQGTGEVKTT